MNHLDELPGWTFYVEETSAGYYVVLGVHRDGRSVQVVGNDPDKLLARCRSDAAIMDLERP
jgi:hypothetical protein